MALLNETDGMLQILYLHDGKLRHGVLVDVGETKFFKHEYFIGFKTNCHVEIRDIGGDCLQYLSHPRQTSAGYMIVNKDGIRTVLYMPLEYVVSKGEEMENEEKWAEAAQWYLLLNEGGLTWKAGWLYEHKLRDTDEAKLYYRRSVDMGYERAKCDVVRLENHAWKRSRDVSSGSRNASSPEAKHLQPLRGKLTAYVSLEDKVAQLKLLVLASSRVGTSLLVVRGRPGEGKTTLAAALIDDMKIRAEFAHICWVNEMSLGEDGSGEQESLLDQLGGSMVEKLMSQEALSALLKQRLHRGSTGKVLLVVDGAYDGWFVPGGHASDLPFGSCVIHTGSLTSGGQLSAMYSGARHIEFWLDPLNDAEARELLQQSARLTSGITHSSEFSMMVAFCDGLPVALKLLGCFARFCGVVDSEWWWKLTREKLLAIKYYPPVAFAGPAVRIIMLIYSKMSSHEQFIFLLTAGMLLPSRGRRDALQLIAAASLGTHVVHEVLQGLSNWGLVSFDNGLLTPKGILDLTRDAAMWILGQAPGQLAAKSFLLSVDMRTTHGSGHLIIRDEVHVNWRDLENVRSACVEQVEGTEYLRHLMYHPTVVCLIVVRCKLHKDLRDIFTSLPSPPSPLSQLIIAHNWLSGSIPPQLSALTNLTRLDLYNNQLSGPIPPQLYALTNLTRLHLSENQLSGPIPPELSALTNLTELYLHHNQLSGPIPPQLSALTNLTRLHLYNNQLSGPIPPQLYALTNLTRLHLSDNQLSGPIPPQLSALTNLTILHLFNNQLSGPIPPQLSDLTNLTELYLSDNQLSGPIPPQLSALTNLTGLYLCDNQLSGPIPPQLSALTNLTRLDLCDNQLSGPIPPQLSSLTNFTRLDLYCNQLSGPIPIPPQLSGLTNLTKLHLDPLSRTSQF